VGSIADVQGMAVGVVDIKQFRRMVKGAPVHEDDGDDDNDNDDDDDSSSRESNSSDDDDDDDDEDLNEVRAVVILNAFHTKYFYRKKDRTWCWCRKD